MGRTDCEGRNMKLQHASTAGPMIFNIFESPSFSDIHINGGLN